VKTSSWIVVAAAVLCLSGCSGSDASAPEAGRSSSAPVDEVALHDGVPCPQQLPDADSSTYGLGTSKPAASAPRLPAPQEAWVCVYGAKDAGPGPDGDGMSSAWALIQAPVPVRPSLLAGLDQLLDDLKPAEADRMCTADLGPRFVLVYRHGTDLTGVSVDDYGCNDVRLTDDPFTTVVGEASQGGAVRGVLRAEPELLDELMAIAPIADEGRR